MKYLKVEVVRHASTELYIEVPDDFDCLTIRKHELRGRIAKIAAETTDRCDWDDHGWEDDLDIQSVNLVTEDEAKQFQVGTI